MGDERETKVLNRDFLVEYRGELSSRGHGIESVGEEGSAGAATPGSHYGIPAQDPQQPLQLNVPERGFPSVSFSGKVKDSCKENAADQNAQYHENGYAAQ